MTALFFLDDLYSIICACNLDLHFTFVVVIASESFRSVFWSLRGRKGRIERKVERRKIAPSLSLEIVLQFSVYGGGRNTDGRARPVGGCGLLESWVLGMTTLYVYSRPALLGVITVTGAPQAVMGTLNSFKVF